MTYISVMTEITGNKPSLPPAVERFVLHWGEMGSTWGVNRSVAQIHALLYISEKPQTAEEISECLALARSNVSNSLKELQTWNLVRRVHVLGDRRDHFEAEADLFEMVRRIAQGRKAREIDPTIAVLRDCVADAEADPALSRRARQRLADMLDFMETVDKGFSEIMRLPSSTLMALVRMGGGIARLIGVRRRTGRS
ncbi:MAG: putative transcriptional regulatory protein [Pseudomonadota bacterium]|jgi:DNA-binding transcriptional regulator GbsR (MarR family)